jgi:hypothetical protein
MILLFTHLHHCTTSQEFRRQSDQQGAVTRLLRSPQFHAMMVNWLPIMKEMGKAQHIAVDKSQI